MKFIFGALFGYVIHDALQPTVVGQVLDKVSLPADLLSTSNQSETPKP